MDYSTQKKYNEFKVYSWKKEGKQLVPDETKQTERGSVMISERDAYINNQMAQNTGLYYELAPVPKQTKPEKTEK